MLWYSILIFPESVGGSGHPIPGGSLDSFVRVTTGESPTTRQSHGKLSSPSQNWNPANMLQVSGVCLLQLSVGQQQGPDLRYLRLAIWKGRDFLDSWILIQILDVVMNNFGTS